MSDAPANIAPARLARIGIIIRSLTLNLVVAEMVVEPVRRGGKKSVPFDRGKYNIVSSLS
jgi:hypothetical protein